MRQIVLKKRVGSWIGRRPLPPAARVFDVWRGVGWWQRLLLPSDFASQAILCQEENLECRRLLTEYLSVSESRRIATLRVGEAREYGWDSPSHPSEFRNRRITFIENEERLKCNRCRGKGRIDCSPDVPCPSCRGRRIRNDFCFTCGGSGRAGQDQKEQCWSCGGRGTRSEDCAACSGIYSGSTGRVRCQRCGGAGWVVCRACAGAGEKLRVRLATRHYTCSAERHYQLGGLAADRFKNGLAPRHFGSFPGRLSFQEYQTPEGGTVVMQRLSVSCYAVASRIYRYRETDFWVNRISADDSVKFVTGNLPWSKPRLAAASIVGAMFIGFLATSFLVF